jgi:hypothetical protein
MGQPPPVPPDAPPAADSAASPVHIRDMPAGPGEYVTYHIDKAIKDLLPPVPYVTENVRPVVAQTLGDTYGYMTDRPVQRDLNWTFWLGVLLFMLTGLSWLSHGGRRTSKRKTIELATSSGDAQALETLPLNPPEPHGSSGVS